MSSKKDELDKRKKEEIAAYTDVDGLEEVLPEDLTIPRLKLDHDRGCLIDDSTNEEFEELEAVLLGIKKSRSMFPPFKPGVRSNPLCQSLDFYYSTSGDSCFICKNNQWSYSEDLDKPTPPKCVEQWTFPLFINGDSKRPALLSVKRTSLSPAKKYVTQFVNKKEPLFSAVTLLSTEPVDNYFVIRFERSLDADEETQRIARSEWQAFKKRFIQVDQPENIITNNGEEDAKDTDKEPF